MERLSGVPYGRRRVLPWDPDLRKHIGNQRSQPIDRMQRRRFPELLRGDMQIDLGAGDQAVPQQVTDRDQLHTFAHQVRGKRVA